MTFEACTGCQGNEGCPGCSPPPSEPTSAALLRAMVEAARAVPSPAPLGDRAAMREWIRLSDRCYAAQKAIGKHLAEGDVGRLCEFECAIEALSEEDQRLIEANLWRPVQPS